MPNGISTSTSGRRSRFLAISWVVVSSVLAVACGVDDEPTFRLSSPSAPASVFEPSVDTTATSLPDPSTNQSSTPAGDPHLVAGIRFTDEATTPQPVDIAWHPDGRGPFIAGKLGTIHELRAGEAVLMLDITDSVTTNSERGLVSIAFDAEGEHLYVHWSNLAGDNVLSAWAWSGSVLDPSAGVDILEVEEPFANHNGGGLAFGPDGHIYWGLGDGGASDDPLNSGQDGSTLLGSILRLSPDPINGGYTIPHDNPFVDDGEVADEAWAIGVRNPWRMAFDSVTGDLWVGDVGQDRFEEINRLSPADAGANLGWRCFEAFEPFGGCEVDRHHLPLVAYGRDLGRSVTGGVVYRGSDIPELFGAYLFADFVSGRIWAIGEGERAAVELPLVVEGAVGLGTDPDGELWLLQLPTGQVGRLTPG
ncbi:MAG: PQQ-dependent sugar dehydrogenase [Actinomycetota bacterium]|nr:PQQ-dependent sugar dehydrogenase [Actinomycetota bacterium]